LIHVARALRRRRRQGNNGRLGSQRRRNDQAKANASETVQVVVFAGKGRRVGLVVERILDIAEETLVARSPARRSGVLFTAVIQGRVTEFLDVEGILAAADPDVVESPQTIAAKS
jgi:hypothetical protein